MAVAHFQLGTCYYKGEGVEQDNAKAFEWYGKAAEQGDARAQHDLGVCYYYGEGVEQDIAKAVILVRLLIQEELKAVNVLISIHKL